MKEARQKSQIGKPRASTAGDTPSSATAENSTHACSTDDTLPTIELSPQVDEVVVAAVEALTADPDIYVRGGNLVRVLPDDEAGIPRIDIATPSVITNVHLSRSANWVRFDERKKIEVPCSPPSSIGLTVRDLGLWRGIRKLNGVITTPILRSDGSVLSTPGYDNQTGLYLRPTVDIDPVPDAPSAADIENAKSLLLETIADFPFVPSGVGVWLSLLIGYFGRQLYDGPSPAVAIDANIRGAGKGLAAEAVGLICLGAALPTTTPTEDEEELRKRITAALIGGRGLVLVHNLPVSGEFGNAIWDTLFTSTLWEDRILGASRVVVLRNHVIWVVTGNNVAIRGDTTRRTIDARLETSLEKPEFRDPKQFRHPDLRGWIMGNRAALVRAILVLLRAWIVADRPVGSRVLGSYEAWSATIASCVEWLGVGNPIDTQPEYEQRRGDAGDAGTLRPLLIVWRAIFGKEPKKASEVVALISNEDLRVQEERRRQLRLGGTDEVPETEVVHAHRDLRDAVVAFAPGRGGGLPTAGTLGKRLGSALRRNAGGLLLDGSLDRTGVYSWRVVAVDPASHAAGDAGCAAGDSSDLSPATVTDTKIDGSDECRGCRGSFPDLEKSKVDHFVSSDTATTQRDIMSELEVARHPLHSQQRVGEAIIIESNSAGDRSDRSPAASPASSTPGVEVDAGDRIPSIPSKRQHRCRGFQYTILRNRNDGTRSGRSCWPSLPGLPN